MMLIEGFKKNVNNSLKEIQKKISQQVKTLKEETQKSLKEIQENMDKQKPLKRKYRNPLKNYRKTQTNK